MEDKDSGDFLGWILVRDYGFSTDYHTPGIIELGWRLKRAYWGQGLTTEAAQAIIDVLKTNPENRRFCALADVDNLTSIGVMKKLGMQFIDNRVHVTPKANLPVAYYEMPSPL